jgi:hypothetical protein
MPHCVFNRANQRSVLFDQPADYDAFELCIRSPGSKSGRIPFLLFAPSRML